MPRAAAVPLAVTLVLSLWGPARAAGNELCSSAVVGHGRSSHVEGSEDWKAYKGNVPDSLARSRAIKAWSAAVKSDCPKSSSLWMRAKERTVACEGTPGHTDCTATATPARSVMSYVTK